MSFRQEIFGLGSFRQPEISTWAEISEVSNLRNFESIQIWFRQWVSLSED